MYFIDKVNDPINQIQMKDGLAALPALLARCSACEATRLKKHEHVQGL